MGLGVEDPLIQRDDRRRRKQEVQVLESLCQEEALHLVVPPTAVHLSIYLHHSSSVFIFYQFQKSNRSARIFDDNTHILDPDISRVYSAIILESLENVPPPLTVLVLPC
ncbi:hypothetical protein MLD38_006752 [Melastoma candidum]|uniref:Uncharacterized protein n=1 Tax=Melastoma candidum TaxID=119954 RepID=A0ACB9RNV8_9MYRT|nr:hypothetical protein MLD38_006752 [Melastoma candidum]